MLIYEEERHRACLTYIPIPHLGFGFVQTCVSILEYFPRSELSPTLYLPRKLAAVPDAIEVREAIRLPLSAIPYRFTAQLGIPLLDRAFNRALSRSDPSSAIAYFWPEAPISLVKYARSCGYITIREMINTSLGTAKKILDEAFDRLGLEADHKITEQAVEREREELAIYDYIFASNHFVEASLIEARISPTKILPSTFGWSPARYAASTSERCRGVLSILFVGAIGVRKGIPQLLAAWDKCGVDGELVLAGHVEKSIKPLLGPYLMTERVRLAGFVPDVARLYKSADIFVFPTLEEGGPQVTYEAAGCGLPVITTPMGAGRMIVNEVNGLLVQPYDIEGLANAISSLASSRELRERLGQQAAKDASNYTYEKIGVSRAETLIEILDGRGRTGLA